MIELDRIYNEDCLEGMRRIPDGSIDAVICDLPYGTTACAWDSVIPFDKLWEQYRRITKPNAAIVLFGSEPFSSQVRMSNPDWYKYDWVWEKPEGANFQLVKYQPLKVHETISVFSKDTHSYYPQGLKRATIIKSNSNKGGRLGHVASEKHRDEYVQEWTNYPRSILRFDYDPNRFHPTQKPVDLLRYLVLTYTNEGDTVLDNCMGSGTTAIACIKEKRHFVGFELSKEYYDKALRRIKAEQAQLTLF